MRRSRIGIPSWERIRELLRREARTVHSAHPHSSHLFTTIQHRACVSGRHGHRGAHGGHDMIPRGMIAYCILELLLLFTLTFYFNFYDNNNLAQLRNVHREIYSLVEKGCTRPVPCASTPVIRVPRSVFRRPVFPCRFSKPSPCLLFPSRRAATVYNSCPRTIRINIRSLGTQQVRL